MINEEKINDAFLEIEKMKLQIDRIVAHIDSEKGTLSREAQRLKDEIEKVEKTFKEIIYDSETGLLVKVDRLTQLSRQIKWIWGLLASGAIAEIFRILHKN